MPDAGTGKLALVSGGAGFIGSHLVASLVARGRPVRVVDSLIAGSAEYLAPVRERIEFIRGDLCDASAALRACEGVDVVFHLAGLPSVAASMEKPLETTQHEFLSTVNLLTAAKDTEVRRFVYSSSSSVYGGEGSLPQHEDVPPRPKSPYAASKACGEIYTRAFSAAYGLEAVCLRYFNVFGPRQPAHSAYSAVFPAFIRRMLNKEPPVIYGDGGQTRDFIYVSDVVEANDLAARSPRRLTGEVLNIGSGRQTSLLDLVALINKILGTDLEAIHQAERPGDVRHSCADISRARELIGFRPAVTVEEGLRQTIEYFRSHAD